MFWDSPVLQSIGDFFASQLMVVYTYCIYCV